MNNDEQLKKKYQQLKQQYELLLDNAHDNAYKQKQFEIIEFQLMSASSIEQILAILCSDFVQSFELEYSGLVLNDEYQSLSRLLPELKQKQYSCLKLCSTGDTLDPLKQLASPIYAGEYQVEKHQWVLTSEAWPKILKSIVLIPLLRQNKIIGVFCYASEDVSRFKQDESCDFLQRLGFVIAICIENAINMARLKLSTITDTLTQVHNRRFFDERLPEELSRRERNLTAVSCLFVDIDHFKQVNDSYGHGVGDEVLQHIAQRIQDALRTQDILARYGGEEFALLLPETDNSEALNVAQRIISTVNQEPIVLKSSSEISVTLSIGLVTIDSDSYTDQLDILGTRLLSTADQALYQAKDQGRNRVVNAGLLFIDDECLA